MSCRITSDCIGCGICIGRCVNRAIFVNEFDCYAVDPLRCTECIDLPRRRCYAICSVGAIEPNPEHRETREELWAKHRALRAVPVDVE